MDEKSTRSVKQGIYENMPFAEYAAIDAVNASLLKAADRSMAHAKAYLDGHRKSSEALSFGAAYHCYLLEPERFEREYVVIDKANRATTAGKAAWATAVERAGGNEDRVVWTETAATFAEMRRALLRANRKRDLTSARGSYEVTAVWTDGPTGLLCKARLDKIVPAWSVILDLKKCEDARPHAFNAAVARYRYHLQAAFYMDGLETLRGERFDFAFLAQEDEAPFESAIYTVTNGDAAHDAGRAAYRQLINHVAQCRASGEWPGYPNEPEEIVLPAWAVPQCVP